MVNKNKKNKNKPKLPFISVCTPTFNRRPFIPMMLKCFDHQTYPKDRIEWLIVDDGTDKIEDLVKDVPQVKYFKFDKKMTLGQKRNFLNGKACGEILVYMDDDDYYPPERFSHAVETLQNSKALCAGSSEMFIYFKHINKMLKFGPYGPNHATAATFAFKRELLTKTKFQEKSCVAEEKSFLKEYTIPFVQLDSMKSILVFSHIHNSFDKKELLNQGPNPCIHETLVTPKDFIKEPEILKFFMEDIDNLLNVYEPGKPENKPDVAKQLIEIRETRAKLNHEHMQKQIQINEALNKINAHNQGGLQNNINDPEFLIKILEENNKLKEKVSYLENKISQLIKEKTQAKLQQKTELAISDKISELPSEKRIELLQSGPIIM